MTTKAARRSHSRFFKLYRVSVPVCRKCPNVGGLATSRPLAFLGHEAADRATKWQEFFISRLINPTKDFFGSLECRLISLEMIS